MYLLYICIGDIRQLTEQNEAIRKEKAEIEAKLAAQQIEKNQLISLYGYYAVIIFSLGQNC